MHIASAQGHAVPCGQSLYINILLCFSGLLLHIIFQNLKSFGHGESFLAHLSRRLIGELIVYEGIRRPSVRHPSVNIFKRHLL